MRIFQFWEHQRYIASNYWDWRVLLGGFQFI